MLTPQDVRSVQFEKNLRGYRTEDVDRFLDKIEEQLQQDDAQAEQLRKQIADLTAENQRLHRELQSYEADGEMLKSALINAQRMGENVIHEANQKAVVLVKNHEKLLPLAKSQKVCIVTFKGVDSGFAQMAQAMGAGLGNTDEDAALRKTLTEAFEKKGYTVVATPEEADVLYGVTMQERGVSRILTINLNDMAKELNIK